MKIPPNPIDVHVGSRCRQRRIELGLSVADIAAGIDTDVDQVAQMEGGAIRIGPDKLMRLSRLLDVDVEFFFKDIQSIAVRSDTGSDLEVFLLMNESRELMRAFVQIESPADRQQVIAFATSFAGPRRSGEFGG